MKNRSIWSYFTGSFIFTLFAIVVCYLLAGPMGAFYAAVLGILETSLSMDNAVVNATVLRDMDDKWKHRFLTWGMIIAVFGMRIVFPILIVWATSPLGLIESATLPFEDPQRYADTLTASHISIAGFGGTFLLMIFLKFFIDDTKDEHWVPMLEKMMVKIGKIEAIQVALSLTIAALFSTMIPGEESMKFLMSSVWGIVAYLLVDGFGSLFEAPEGASVAVKSGLAGFMYLELVDASFSFDGVIGAFAVTNNIILIALGLGIGAMFVRSLTIMLVDKGTLEQFRYLEHGAFWSIGVLAACMYAGVVIHVPEVVTGVSAAFILGVALFHSIMSNRRDTL